MITGRCLCPELRHFLTGSPVKRCGLRGCLEPTDVRGGPAAPRLPPLALKVPITELWPWQGIRKRPQCHSAQQLGRGTSPSVMPSTAPALQKRSANTTGTILWQRCPHPGITEQHRGCSPSSEERLPRAGCVMWAQGALCQRGPGSPAAPPRAASSSSPSSWAAATGCKVTAPSQGQRAPSWARRGAGGDKASSCPAQTPLACG